MSKTPQLGIFNEEATHFYFLEYHLNSKNSVQVKQVIAGVLNTCKKQCPAVSIVVSFGETAWHFLQPNWMPSTLKSFKTLHGEKGHQALSTQADLFFWVHGIDISQVFDIALTIDRQLKSIAHLALQERGFSYHQNLDLIGFEDGTANPETDELKLEAAVIAEGLPGAGGCLVLSQKWLHDLEKWNDIPIHCQEAVVGRTKLENIELEGEAMPSDSHISRTDLKVDEVAMKIYRRSAPFGSVTEKGLFFLAFGCELLRFTTQLESMYGLTEDHTIDQLLNFSKAVTGSYWFAPSQEDLEALLVVPESLSEKEHV
ncbi:hypothetical protein MNBD_GAMMA03-769 [hydrothermal vent metagenome]|uniref:Uncharacterized protein n=1 Tax=hydrothermal vent metagenome TaxID=652676 RepID=A0A3B0W146_9ZZZZ